MTRSLVVAAVLFVAAGATSLAQDRPAGAPLAVKRDRVDLSGRWEAADSSGRLALGREFTVTQDLTSITIETAATAFTASKGNGVVFTAAKPVRHTYSFNGVESRENRPAPASFADLDPRHILSGYTSSVSSRAAWRGDQLAIVTHSTMRTHMPRYSPSVFESELTTQLLLSLDADGTLIAERTIIADPEMDSALRLDLPGVVKTVYRSGGR